MFSDTEVALMRNQGKFKATINEWETHPAKLQALVMQKDASIAGLLAQIEQLKAEAPNAPSLQVTAEVYKEGKNAGQKKTKLRKIYEAAFDAATKKMGIANPLSIRTN